MSKVFLNGDFVDETEASVPVSDRGFLYGDGLFETMRAYHGTVFRLSEHVKRLSQSASTLRIPVKLKPADVEGVIAELLALNELADAYVRITTTRGEHTGDLALDTGKPPTLLITAREYHGYSPVMYRRGMKLTIARSVRHGYAPLGRYKTLNYLENLIARDAARTTGFDEILFLDESGCITECATANLFFVSGGNLCTASEEMNILPGITRSVVMEAARWGGRKVLDRRWPFRELQSADEVFLTNSLMEVMPVAEIAAEKIGEAVPGPITQELAAEYRRLVEEECRKR